MRKYWENIHPPQLRTSEELKSMMALYAQDTVQNGEPLSYSRLGQMVRRHIDFKLQCKTQEVQLCKQYTVPRARCTRSMFSRVAQECFVARRVPLLKNNCSSFSRIVSHAHSLRSDLPPFPPPQHIPSLLYHSHSGEQPLDPRTAGRSGRLAIQSPLTF